MDVHGQRTERQFRFLPSLETKGKGKGSPICLGPCNAPAINMSSLNAVNGNAENPQSKSPPNGVHIRTTVVNGNHGNDDNGEAIYSEQATKCHVVWLGGPGTLLPRPVESFMGWCLAISCLSVSGYHYVVSTMIRPTVSRFLSSLNGRRRMIKNDEENNFQSFPCWLPLTTTSRREQASHSRMERYQQLVHAIQIISKVSSAEELTDLQAASIIRENHTLRRLATLAMRPFSEDKHTKKANDYKSPHTLSFGQRLIRIWPQLLALPPPPHHPSESSPQSVGNGHRTDQTKVGTTTYKISLIVPVYKENGKYLLQRLKRAKEKCVTPQHVQVILVHAGHCDLLTPDSAAGINDDGQQQHIDDDDESVSLKMRQLLNKDDVSPSWGEISVRQFTMGGGRGPCLNYGATCANGEILTFLHGDTRLPASWDIHIRQGLGYDNGDCRMIAPKDQRDQKRPIACAFSFGIDTSTVGLQGGPYPPGIKAIETTANLRTHFWKLPYGDQCISVPSIVFHYIGGFPDQCLMEDYELVALLRQRVALLTKFAVSPSKTPSSYSIVPEQLVILNPPPTLCSPRRWQRFGVLYVTWMNSKCVNLYSRGMTPDDLFHLYYGQLPPTRTYPNASPWEIELQEKQSLLATK